MYTGQQLLSVVQTLRQQALTSTSSTLTTVSSVLGSLRTRHLSVCGYTLGKIRTSDSKELDREDRGESVGLCTGIVFRHLGYFLPSSRDLTSYNV